ncbi:MAG TPA: acyl-CoA dehydrogenase family protein [Longimicrobiales bacterium]|nr:acyl-CoA dehydrogenase family protein [Longimicrobiales bacterium]
MDFAWSDEQKELRESVVRFAESALQDDLGARDQEGCFSRDLWTRCAEFGIQGLPFPERWGGSGAGILSTVLAMEALGSACADNGLLFALNAQMWSVQMPIFRHGDDQQRERYLTRLCSGEWIGAHAMSEPDSGSDAFALRTTARRDGDAYVLNGLKTFVSEAPVADLFLVFATLDRGKGVLGITGFLVERGTPGLSLGKPLHKMGLTTSPMSEVILDDCRVPAANRLGKEGRAAAIFNDSMEWERACILAPCLGAMERQLVACLRHARAREQFGHRIGDFQSVSNKLAEMRIRADAARLLLYRAAWLKEQGLPAASEAAVAKWFVADALVRSGLDAIQVHGGYGYMREYGLERDLRDFVGSTLYSGTSEIQLALIARGLGL